MRQNTSVLAASLLLSLTALNAEASLTAYNAAGNNPVVYSSISNITWTGDASLLGTLEARNPNLVSTIISTIGSITDTPNGSNSGSHTLTTADFGANGLVSWFGAKAFTSYLNTINYGGSNQWALPSAGANPAVGYNQTGAQFGQLFYNELGGTADSFIPSGPFSNVQLNVYWSGTEYAANPIFAWNFNTNGGYQYVRLNKSNQLFAWAVSPGQVSAVPVPGAVWLMSSGLLGFIGLKRRS